MALVPTYVGTYVLWHITYMEYQYLYRFFMSKSIFLLRQSLTRIRIRIGLAPWIPIETKTDPKHCTGIQFTVPEFQKVVSHENQNPEQQQLDVHQGAAHTE